MGADMLVYTLPACHLSEARDQEMCLLIDNIPDKEFENTQLADACEEDEDDIRKVLKDYYLDFAGNTDSRELACMDDPDWKYPLFVTGGLSWGDTPTEIADPMGQLENIQPIWDRLAMWAIEDKTRKGGLYAKGGRLHAIVAVTTDG